MSRNIAYLNGESKAGDVTEVGDHYFIRNGVRHDFDNLISTIPLDNLLSLCKMKHDLQALPIHYVLAESASIDFEGANQALVVDRLVPFFKATNIAKGKFLFCSTSDMVEPWRILSQFVSDIKIIDGTCIDRAIPTGELPDLKQLEAMGITCIGSSAEWDWAIDVGSAILRVIKYAQRGYHPNKPKSF
jgi:hypothetical protein